ncbi:hypothetical protein IEQ34_021913 [Dendrobium chrysotoxum]|uniref:Uncharacterized protein n=1 Tax=Dendrobium chrysotoxum TaxID=161865 RepID=A0AAV7FXK4_DENCH|nr:hypothetical protein IEQ34_021913 [Dendrobium chrysotoxum]
MEIEQLRWSKISAGTVDPLHLRSDSVGDVEREADFGSIATELDHFLGRFPKSKPSAVLVGDG